MADGCRVGTGLPASRESFGAAAMAELHTAGYADAWGNLTAAGRDAAELLNPVVLKTVATPNLHGGAR